ncbi:transcriptional repressor LexA [Periweissella fabaria]|uniref:LexA repressor n=1 Tax=Periweissella fabaria TaxID=546157 RepID=A0ABN8BKL1_9LACO|nr:transcriptional repressor LexA [Periweissella fabaria]MCM0597184.1 transcriptional repressor LexA [Periweissella fabaria]CAH0417031.1 LexA repressor [Periweissella fabaria]
MARGESKQIEVLRFIYEKQTQKGYPPTVREICEAVGLASTSTVHGHIVRLQTKGYLRKDSTKPRAIEITDEGLEILGISNNPGQIPVVGLVTAGSPILAVEEQATEFFPLPDDLAAYDGDLFMLNVTGTSMINIGILDGDQVIVRKQNQADNGDIVVALTEDDEATVKRFFRESGHYRLQPENDTMEPIILDTVTILGKVVGLYRNSVY